MIEDIISDPVTINVGSPQGAILSPTIFIILISDIGLYSDSTIFGYADDTTSTVSGTDIPMLVAKCEEEAKKIIDYMSIRIHVFSVKQNSGTENFQTEHCRNEHSGTRKFQEYQFVMEFDKLFLEKIPGFHFKQGRKFQDF